MNRFAIALFVVAAAVCSREARAQSGGARDVLRDVSFEGVERLPAAGQFYRAYTEIDELRIRISLVQHSAGELIVDQRRMRDSTVSVSTVTGAEIPVTVRWLDGVLLPSETGLETQSLEGLVEIEPGKAVSWVLVVARVNGGPFTAGDYSVLVNTPRLESVVQKPGGTAWTGRAASGPWEVLLTVRPPTTTAERIAMYKWTARDAQHRRAYDEAAEAYARLIAENPKDSDAKLNQADMLMFLGRYREAIVRYEEVVPVVSPGMSASRSALALAYIAVGDEANATRVLRLGGLSEGNITAELGALRQKVRQRRP